MKPVEEMSRAELRAEVVRLRALVSHSHPRTRLITLMLDADEPQSPKMLAPLIGMSLPATAYHVRVLADRGALRLVREEPRRGATEHFYTLHKGES